MRGCRSGAGHCTIRGNQLVSAIRGFRNNWAGDELAVRGFERKERRLVQFWDTEECILNRYGFALRERADLGTMDAHREIPS